MMMNVGIMFYAARETSDRRLRDIAVRHCLTTRRCLVRGDGSTAHEGIFDRRPASFCANDTTGISRRFMLVARIGLGVVRVQLSYEYSRDPRFLETAEACADYYITQCTATAFRRGISMRRPRIVAAGYLGGGNCRGRFVPFVPPVADPMKGHYLLVHCDSDILRTLCEQYLASSDPKWEGILKGGVYHLPQRAGRGRIGDVGRVLLHRIA